MDRSLSIAQKEEQRREKFDAAEINMLVMFEDLCKVLNTQLDHVKRELLGGPGKEPAFKAKLIDHSTKLGRLIEKVTGLWLKIQAADLKRAQSRSIEDKKRYMVTFAQKLPPGHRQTLIEALSEALMLKIERTQPVGRPPENWVHPMDK